ncbi:MAG: sulfurtransferase TusA family protein [Thiomicrospira sp.]|nr:MAG: sulfurtransferase TusA family protein [Thiomicrospira sp.]
MAETTRIDAKGLKCPMPVIKLQQQTRKSHAGDRLLIECTDPGAEKDITSWCRVNKHRVIKIDATNTGCTIEIEVHTS